MKKTLIIFLGVMLMIQDAIASNEYFWIYNYTREKIVVYKTYSSCRTSGNLHYYKGPINADDSISPIRVGGPYTAYVGTTSSNETAGTILIQGTDEQGSNGSYCTVCYDGHHDMSKTSCHGQFFLSHYPVNSNSQAIVVGKDTLKTV